jgi:hypothetical protein
MIHFLLMNRDHQTTDSDPQAEFKLYWALHKRDHRALGAQDEYKLTQGEQLPDESNDVFSRDILGLGPTKRMGWWHES